MSQPQEIMPAFRAALAQLLKNSGRSQKTLALEADVTPAFLNQIIHGKREGSQTTLVRIARAFGYDIVDFLALGRRLLAEERGEEPRDPLEALAGPLRPVPVFDANCGDNGIVWSDGGLPVGEGLETIDLPVAWLNENSFCLRVHNDSMEPTLREGDIVLVNPNATVVSGDVVFARLPNGEKLIKRYRQSGGQVVLTSDNSEYGPVVLDSENGDGAKIFKVVKMVRTL